MGGRGYEEDFRAPLDVPSDHPTHEQEMMLRRRRILALNRMMKAREDALWQAYAVSTRLLRLLESSHTITARRGFCQFKEAVQLISRSRS